MEEKFELSHWKLHRTAANILFVAKEEPLAKLDLPFALAKHALTLKTAARARFINKVLKEPETRVSQRDKERFKRYIRERPSRRIRPMHSEQVKKLARKLAKDPNARLSVAERKLKSRFFAEIRRQIH